MKKLSIISLLLLAVGAFIAVSLPTGCVTSKVTTVDPNTGFTNVTTVVDTANLAIDASVLQGVTAVAVTIAIDKDPTVVQPLKDAQKALDGVLNGANQATTQDVINGLKAQGNPALSAEVSSLVSTISAVEQKLLAKYGVTVAGQITLELTKAVDAGMIIGLQGK